MNDTQYWTFIGDLFEQIADQCDDMLRIVRGPISDDEAKQLLSDAKEFLKQGE